MDRTEKLIRQKSSLTLKFEPFLPCATQDCLGEATIGNATYDPAENAWIIFPFCRECVKKMVKNYGVE